MDEPATINAVIETLVEISSDLQVVFPVHPRTRKRLAEFGVALPDNRRFRIVDPLGYLEFLALQKQASLVITDSGGVQEETTYLQVPCLTIRQNTERPITTEVGSNILVGRDMCQLKREANRILCGGGKRGQCPALWDGKASERIAEVLAKAL